MELQVNFSSPVVTNQHEGDNARHNPREANPETSRGPNSLSSEPAHGVTPRERPRHGGIVASPVERLRAFWTRIEED